MEKRELHGVLEGKIVDYCSGCGYVDPEYDRMIDGAREARRLR